MANVVSGKIFECTRKIEGNRRTMSISKEKIKNILTKTRLGRGLLAFKRVYRYDEYWKWLSDFYEHNIFKFQEFGPLNSDKVLYVINELKSGSGFFFSWLRTCRGLMVAERFGFIPIVDWSKGAYFDKNGLNGCMNPFEYFFEPISSISLTEAMQSKNVAFFDQHTDGSDFSLYEYHDDQVENFSRINTKYLHIKSELYAQICKEIRNLLGEKRTLAVHVRGVEWGNVKGHPIPVSLEAYAEKIDFAINKYGYKQIFLATDSENTIDFFKLKYRDKIVFYNDVIRSKKNSKVLAIMDVNIKRKNNGFLLGCEVLKDMLTLSFCDGLVAGLSCVSFAADVFKRGRGESYIYKDYVDQKVCKKGIPSKMLGDRFKENM